ncbi:type II haloacid dehalogenase [Coleophoma crateriformis]|uniref:Type II haloacid dehalogenase n=1 Tax=Coleophoma crateriformis TaxID=565419 RepID=A0A3D8R7G8_9HELO|nr:type II haloacid dehalogenase [Coleophoma crateriformis]
MSFEPTQVKGLFFDIYATLIDWEAGIYPFLLRLAQKLPQSYPLYADTTETRKTLLHMYAATERVVEHENPTLAYPQILEKVYARIAAELGVVGEHDDQVAFGRGIGEWPAFPDTVAAMQTLAKYYKLVVLSNVDDASFTRTCAGPLKSVHWDAVYTAEQIGSYKPNPANYNYVATKFQDIFGIPKDQIALVAQSLDIDHMSCKALGFKPGVWIARGASHMGGSQEEMEAKGLIELGATYITLGEFATAVERAFSS